MVEELRVGHFKKKSISDLYALIIVIFFLSGLMYIPLIESEPIVTDNLNGTFTADWPLENSGDYNLYNLTLENGVVNLSLHSYWWNQTTQSEFESGSTSNIDTTSSPGDMMLIDSSFGSGMNLIANGEFETNTNWSYASSDNITSQWFSSGEYGRLNHYSASNPIYQGEQNVSSATGTGTEEPPSTPIGDCLEFADGSSYYETDQGEILNITGFDIGARHGKISEVWLNAIYLVEDGYSGSESLRYRNESGTFKGTTILPVNGETAWTPKSHDITDAFTTWTWSDVENLEVSFRNDDGAQSDFIWWDRIWLEITIEPFDQTAYINQTFEVFNSTGFNDSLFEDFSKATRNNNVNFNLQPDSVVLDYAGSVVKGQMTLYANETGGNATWIYSMLSNYNNGNSINLWVGGDDLTSITRSLLRFNIAALPPGATIINATLQLWVKGINHADVEVAVHKLDLDWDEGWQDNQVASDGATWEVADTNPLIEWADGGQFDPAIYNITTFNLSKTGYYHDFNISTLVQEWMDGSPNNGLLLKDTDESAQRSVNFVSDDDPGTQRPMLVVQYELPNYHTYGNFTSQVFDAGKIVNDWGNISWNYETPPGTNITIQTRTSSDNVSWGSWGTNHSQPGVKINFGPGRYIQYNAHLSTNSSSTTPILQDVTIIFERTNLTFDRVIESAQNVARAELSITIDDKIVWDYITSSSSPWTPEIADISEWILEKGFHDISLQLRLIIESENEVDCIVGYDNVSIGGLGNQTRGEYISIGYDAGTKAIWEEISWSQTLDPETRIIIQTQTSQDNFSWGPWSSAYSNPSGDPITSQNNRYIRYRAILITNNESNTPTLSDVNILYSYYSINGTLEMKNDFIPAAVSNWGQLSNISNLKGQKIEFFYSIDSGSNWWPVDSSGDMSLVDTNPGKIKFKLEFTTTDTSISPALFEFSLLYLLNNPPQFGSAGYKNQAGGFGEGWFNFSVMYLDLDDNYPIPIKLTITGDGNYNLTMNELDGTDYDMINGKWFFLNLTLPKGSYQYRFIAYDGIIWNSTLPIGFDANNNPSELRYPRVSPTSSISATLFNFTVSYYDKDDDAPVEVKVVITGPSSYNISLTEFDSSDIVYFDGKDYYLELQLDKGSYIYNFFSSDGDDWVSTSPTPLNVINSPPELTFPLVIPPDGNVTTTFNFTITYSDFDNDEPGSVFLNLSGPSNPGPHVMLEFDSGDIVYSDGKLYYFVISNLTKGQYSFHFAASDFDGDWGETAEYFAPLVLNSEPIITTVDVTNVNEDSFYSVLYNCIDSDGEDCTWILETNATWLDLDSNSGYLNGTPDNGDVGWFWVNVSVSDNDGGLDWTYFILIVVNTPPQITTISPLDWAIEGNQYVFDFNAEDEGEGNAQWSVDTNGTWLTIDPNTGVLTGTPTTTDVGMYWVNISFDDGNGGFDSLNFTITVTDSSSPLADAGPDDTTFEDAIYTFDGSGSSDNSGVISNYTWYFGDGKMGYGIAPTHVYSNEGVYLVVLIVKDPYANEGYDTMELTVNNPAPFADAGSDKTVNEGERVDFDASGSYDTTSDIPNLVYLWDFNNDGNFDDGIGVLSSYIWYDEGVNSVGLMVKDDNGDSSIHRINVTVTNLPPSVDLGGPYSGFEGAKIYFFATAIDPGVDTLWFRWDWDNDGVNDTWWNSQSHANHTWSLFGSYTIGVEVWDGDDGYTIDTASVDVIRPEQPPVISGVGGRYVHYDYPYILDLDPYISDPDTFNSDLIITTDSSYIDVSGLILTLNYPQTMVGKTDVVIINVSDGKNYDIDTLTVSITDNYPPEVSGEIPDMTFDEGDILLDAFNPDNYFTDRDNDPLTYHFLGAIHVRSEINSSTKMVSLSAEPNWYGVENVTVRAYDPFGAFSEQLITVTVNAVNFPPTIEGIHDVFVRMNSPWELLVLNPVYVWDDENILDLNLYTDSSFVTLSPTKEGVLVFYYIDPLIDTEIVKISVSDGEFTASMDVTVHVSSDNWPPYIKDFSYPSTVRFDEDTTLTNYFNLNDYFADNATDVLAFTQIVESSNLIVTIDSQGQVSFSSHENWFGVSTVTFRAQDESGAWASFKVNVSVDSVNDAPVVIQSITYRQINEDETWVIDLDDYFFDIEDATNLTYSCNKPDIIIDPVTHEARWVRNSKTSQDNVVFTASDGELSVSTEEIDLKVVETFNILWLVLAFGLGMFGVFLYRELRYRFRVEEAFLVNNAGILMTHLSRGESKMALDVELVSAMLTAVQEFVKDSFVKGETDSEATVGRRKSLEKLEFGEFHLVLEQGKYSFLCAVISGYENKRLRKNMKVVLEEFEDEYGDILSDWDGVMETFEKAQSILAQLFRQGSRVEEMRTSITEMKSTDEGVTLITYEDSSKTQDAAAEIDEADESEDAGEYEPPSPL
jgi:hypothetical protein